MRFRFHTIAAALSVAVGFASTGAIDAVAARPPEAAPVRISGPPIGIHVQPYRKVNEHSHEIWEGVRVVRDSKRRPLHRRDNNGRWRHYHFRVGYDVIVQVNGMPVSSARDVLSETRHGWNELYIYDIKTRVLARYKVKL